MPVEEDNIIRIRVILDTSQFAEGITKLQTGLKTFSTHLLPLSPEVKPKMDKMSVGDSARLLGAEFKKVFGEMDLFEKIFPEETLDRIFGKGVSEDVQKAWLQTASAGLQTIRMFSMQLGLTDEQMKSLGMALAEPLALGRISNLGDLLAVLSNRSAFTETQLGYLRNAFSSLPIPLDVLISRLEAFTTGVQRVGMHGRELKGTLGVVGNTAMMLGRTFFWVGLGSMFLTMSFSRVVAQSRAVRQEILGLVKSHLSLARQEEDYIETLQEHGAGSKEARRAYQDLILAKEEAKLKSDQLTDSVKLQNMAMAMLAFSGLGQVVGMGQQLIYGLGFLNSGVTEYIMLGNAQMRTTMSNAVASELYSQKIGTQTVMQTMLNSSVETSFWALMKQSIGLITAGHGLSFYTAKALLAWGATMALIGAITMGIPFLISLGATYAMTTYQMSKMTEEAKKLEKQLNLVYHGSGVVDLTKGLVDMNRGLDSSLTRIISTSKALDEMHSVTGEMPVDMRPIIGERELPIEFGLSKSGSSINIGSVNINITSTIGDPKEIEKAVSRGLLKGIKNAGVKGYV